MSQAQFTQELAEMWKSFDDTFDYEAILGSSSQEGITPEEKKFIEKQTQKMRGIQNYEILSNPELFGAIIEIEPLLRSKRKSNRIEKILGRMRRSDLAFHSLDTATRGRFFFDSDRSAIGLRLQAAILTKIEATRNLKSIYSELSYLTTHLARCRHPEFRDSPQGQILKIGIEEFLSDFEISCEYKAFHNY